MANSDKDILITPNRGQTAEPIIKWNGANNTPLYTRVLDDGSISFEGTAGQLFSISDGLSGSIFSVNDISGIPSIEVLDTGVIKLAEFGGKVGMFTSAPTAQLDIRKNGNIENGNIILGVDTNNIDKYSSILSRQYASAAEPEGFALINGTSISGNNIVNIGGALVEYNSATTITFYTGASATTRTGSERMRITNDGNVGIGISNPSSKLQVSGDIRLSNTTNKFIMYDFGGGNTAYMMAASSGDIVWYAGTSASAERVRITSTGTMGIGTNNPDTTFKLEVNGGAKALGVIVTKTAAYTLVLADNGEIIEVNTAAQVDVTIPTNASVAFPIGTQIMFVQIGVGQIRVVGASGVTVRSKGSRNRTDGQYTAATIYKRGTDEWVLTGDLVV